MLKNQLSELTDNILQQALQAEYKAFYLYRHISIQCQRLGLFGAAKFFASESTDEQSHAKRIEDYFNDRGTVALLPNIESPDVPVRSLADALQSGYDLEVELGDKYAKWHQSLLSKDCFTAQFLLQFLEIQRLSIGKYADWLQRLQLVGDDKCGVLMIDKEIGKA